MAEINAVVNASVELEVGEKTAAWLETLGWVRPVVTEEKLVAEKVLKPSEGVAAAKVAMNSREAARAEAQQDYTDMLTQLSSPERLTSLLRYFGVDLEKFLEPVVVVEIPGLAEGNASA
jgi:hypothetical protein